MKRFLFIVLAIVFVTGCDSKTSSEKITITVIGENSSSIQALMSLKKSYEDTHPNVIVDFKPNTFDDAFSKSNQDFANKTGLYDIVMQYNFSLSSMVRNDYVYHIDDLLPQVPDSLKTFEKNLFPNQWKEVGYYYKNGKDKKEGTLKVGYPFAALSVLLMYNKEMFADVENQQAFKAKYHQDLNVPTNWEAFYKTAEFFTQAEQQTKGVCLAGGTGGFLYYEFMNFLYGMNGKIMDKQTGWEGNQNSKIFLNSPEALKALTLYTSLKPYNSGDFSSVEQFEQMKIMKKGKTAMALVWSDILYPSLHAEAGFDPRFAFAPVPGGRSIALGGAFFINKQSKNPKVAAQYIIDLMQPKMQIALAKNGLCSGSQLAYQDPEVKKIPYTNPLFTSLKRGGVVIEAGPDANMISEVITTYVQKVWNKELTPQAALSQAQAEIEKKRADIYKTIQ
ncbi:ABC transporter substrate-binding protein [Mucilaginibacter sp.]